MRLYTRKSNTSGGGCQTRPALRRGSRSCARGRSTRRTAGTRWSVCTPPRGSPRVATRSSGSSFSRCTTTTCSTSWRPRARRSRRPPMQRRRRLHSRPSVRLPFFPWPRAASCWWPCSMRRGARQEREPREAWWRRRTRARRQAAAPTAGPPACSSSRTRRRTRRRCCRHRPPARRADPAPDPTRRTPSPLPLPPVLASAPAPAVGLAELLGAEAAGRLPAHGPDGHPHPRPRRGAAAVLRAPPNRRVEPVGPWGRPCAGPPLTAHWTARGPGACAARCRP